MPRRLSATPKKVPESPMTKEHSDDAPDSGGEGPSGHNTPTHKAKGKGKMKGTPKGKETLEPLEEPTEELLEVPAPQPIKKPVKKPAVEPGRVLSKTPIKKPAKRPADEPAEESSGDPPEESATKRGVDCNGDPLLKLYASPTERAILRVPPERHIDWREGKGKPINSPANRRATYSQQFGYEAPKTKECLCCRNKNGPFASCRVAVIDDKVQFSGTIPKWLKAADAKVNGDDSVPLTLPAKALAASAGPSKGKKRIRHSVKEDDEFDEGEDNDEDTPRKAKRTKKGKEPAGRATRSKIREAKGSQDGWKERKKTSYGPDYPSHLYRSACRELQELQARLEFEVVAITMLLAENEEDMDTDDEDEDAADSDSSSVGVFARIKVPK
ncbi:hypothetical protein N7490_001830 [Penicillium lividum]|nr:hypothetical protein N7490_001830 [Penicillium lividum]